jgi:DNA polymerase-4
VIRPGEGARFVESLPVRRFHGVGPRGAERWRRWAFTPGAICARAIWRFAPAFRRAGRLPLSRGAGIDLRRVSPNRAQVAGGERTFDRDISSGPGLRGALEGIIDLVWGDIAKAQAKGRTITLKLRLSDFTIHTHARTLDHVVSAREEFAAVARALLDDVLPLRQPARLMGLTLSGLEERPRPPACAGKGADGPVLIGLPA